jgi:hypothetical protein
LACIPRLSLLSGLPWRAILSLLSGLPLRAILSGGSRLSLRCRCCLRWRLLATAA